MIEIPSTFDSESMSLLHNCDEIIVLLDAEDPNDQKKELIRTLKKRHLSDKKTLFVVNKSDLDPGSKHSEVSAKERTGLEELKEKIWDNLGLIRVYTKSPGKKPDFEDPIILKKGSTVEEAAEAIHKDFRSRLKYAQVWGSGKFNGQRVKREHVLNDGDIVELHT